MSVLRRWPFFFLLFAAYPIVNLYIRNAAQVPFEWMLPSLGVTLVATFGMFLVAWRVLGDHLRAGLLVSLCVVCFFGYVHVRSLLFAAVTWSAGHDAAYTLVRHRYLVPVWVLSFGAATATVVMKGRRWQGATPGVNAVALALIAMPLAGHVFAGPRSSVPSAPLFEELPSPSVPPKMRPDIYYVILDAYGSQRVLEQHYQYDNREFIESLKRRGFYVASESRTNYPESLFSLSSSLNMAHLVDFSDWDYQKLARTIEVNRLERFLKSIGYSIVRFPTYWYPTRASGQADLQFRARTDRWDEFSELVFRTTMLDMLVNIQAISARDHTLYVFEKLPDIPRLKQPKFVFAHIICPHPPYVFDRDGNPTPGEVILLPSNDVRTRQYYVDQVIFINKQVEKLVDALITRSEIPPVIVIQGDHGPGRAGGADPIPFFGILNAYYLPSAGSVRLGPSITPVNSFRMILDQYFGTNLGRLDDKSYRVRQGPNRRAFVFAGNDVE